MGFYAGGHQPQFLKPRKPLLAVGLVPLIITPLIALDVFRRRLQGIVRCRKREIGKERSLVLLAVRQKLYHLIREVVG